MVAKEAVMHSIPLYAYTDINALYDKQMACTRRLLQCRKSCGVGTPTRSLSKRWSLPASLRYASSCAWTFLIACLSLHASGCSQFTTSPTAALLQKPIWPCSTQSLLETMPCQVKDQHSICMQTGTHIQATATCHALDGPVERIPASRALIGLTA